MQRVIITTYHDVDDTVADALRDDLTTDTGSADDESTLLEFMRAHPAQTWNATGPLRTSGRRTGRARLAAALRCASVAAHELQTRC